MPNRKGVLRTTLLTRRCKGVRRSFWVHLRDNVPQAIYDIEKRIMDKYDLHDCPRPASNVKITLHSADSDTRNHTDAHFGPAHFRANLLLIEPEEGGMWKVDDKDCPMHLGELMAFDSAVPHAVECVEKGQRMCITYGWIKAYHLPDMLTDWPEGKEIPPLPERKEKAA